MQLLLAVSTTSGFRGVPGRPSSKLHATLKLSRAPVRLGLSLPVLGVSPPRTAVVKKTPVPCECGGRIRAGSSSSCCAYVVKFPSLFLFLESGQSSCNIIRNEGTKARREGPLLFGSRCDLRGTVSTTSRTPRGGASVREQACLIYGDASMSDARSYSLLN